MNQLLFLTRSMFFLCSIGLSGQVSAKSLDILDFKPHSWSLVEAKQLCQQNKVFCSDATKVRRIDLKEYIWVLSDETVAYFQRSSKGLKQLNSWHIKTKNNDENEQMKTFIYPRLFPMSQQRFAIALINESSEYYSGGGAQIQRVDFYALDKSNQARRFIADYPFYFSRMVRACFSYEDYQKAQDQCHDLDGLEVDIQVKQAMKWQFRYQYFQEVSPVSDSILKSSHQRKTITIDLNHPPNVLSLPEAWNYQGQE